MNNKGDPEKVLQRFVIFAMPRTGSGLLARLLDSHPQVRCHKELFHSKHIDYYIDEKIHGLGIRCPGLIPERREGFLTKWAAALDENIRQIDTKKKTVLRCTVVGSGSGAVKFALWIKDEIRKILAEKGYRNSVLEVSILPGRSGFLKEHSPAAKLEVEHEFKRSGIQIQSSMPITEVKNDGVHLSDGRFVAADIVVIVEKYGGPCPDFNNARYGHLDTFLQEARFYDDIRFRDSDPERFLGMFFDKNRGEAEALGFKLMLVQNKKAIKICAGDPALKKIVLRRANLLAAFSSEQIMTKARQSFLVRADISPKNAIKIDFNPWRFAKYRKSVSRIYNNFQKTNPFGDSNWLDIEYRELNDPQTHRKLCSFLGVEINERLHSSSKKLNTWNILERFSNPDRVWNHLKKINKKEWAEE